MNYRLALILAWAAATAVSVVVGFAAVASVRTVISSPTSFRLAAEADEASFDLTSLETATPPGAIGSDPSTTVVAEPSSTSQTTTTSTPPDTDNGSESATPTSQASNSSSTSASNNGEAATATTTTAAPSPTTTSPSSSPPTSGAPKSNAYEVEGGWVSITSDSDGVHLESATSKPGWTATVESRGPEEVAVKFRTSNEEIKFVAKLEDGKVRIKIED